MDRRVLALSLLLCSAHVVASNYEDEAPSPDVAIDPASAPPESGIKIPDLLLTPSKGEPEIDGNINDDFWLQATGISLDYELYPTRLAPAIVETKAWIAISTTHVFVAFRAYDPDPDQIRSSFGARDASKEDDYVSIIIDATGTLAKKYEFRVNPMGILSDVVQDTISERYIYDWDARWQGAAQRDDQGFTVEIAIPFASIRSPPVRDEEDHKGIVILKRSYPRRVDRILATFFSFQRGTGAGQVSGETARRSLGERLTARAYYIYHLDEKRPIDGSFVQVDEHNLHEAGADLAFEFESATTVALTINPNFTDVEADIARQSINNPFNVFQPEKRRFFRVTTEYYNTLIPTVYTRNVIRPAWGMSYLRDNVNSSVSLIGVRDRETEVIVPDAFGSKKVELLETSHAAAIRYRYSKDKRTIGAIATMRVAEGYHNVTGGVDGLLDLGIDDKLRYQVLVSDSKYPQRFAEDLCEEDGCTLLPPPVPCLIGDCALNAQVLRTNFGGRVRGHGIQARYKHDGVNSLYWVGYEEYAPDFRADLGFQRRVDIRSINMAYGRKWYMKALEGDDGKSRVRGYLVYTHTRSHDGNERLENGIGVWFEFRGSYQTVLRVGKRYRERAVNRIDQASLAYGINAPLFDEEYWQWYFETSPWSHVTLNVDGRVGEIADPDNLVLGDMVELKPKLSLRLGRLQLITSLTNRQFDVDGQRLYRERFVSLTVAYRASDKIGHRLLYLDELTNRDTDRWLGDELRREVDREFEYTFRYDVTGPWSVLAGFKSGFAYRSDVDAGDTTNREFYAKIERRF